MKSNFFQPSKSRAHGGDKVTKIVMPSSRDIRNFKRTLGILQKSSNGFTLRTHILESAMPLLPTSIDLADPSVDTTRDFCGNSLHVEVARSNYRNAYMRVMEYAVALEQLPGDVFEFGTYSGFTTRILAECMAHFGAKGKLQSFDSFEGFPLSNAAPDINSLKVAVQKWWQGGALPALPQIETHIRERLSPILGPDRVFVHRGFFDATLPPVIGTKKASVVHIDCDLYSSAKCVLDILADHDALQDGTVLLFDDFYCNRANPNFGEQAALRDFLANHKEYSVSPWFSYGATAAAFFLHDKRTLDQSQSGLG